MIELFYDSDRNIFIDSPINGEELITQPINLYDNATPSGISEAVKALQKLYSITDKSIYLDILISQFNITTSFIGDFPSGFSNWLKILLMHYTDTVQVCLLSYDPVSVSEMRKYLYKKFIPNKVVVGNAYFSIKNDRIESLSPLFEERCPESGVATVFICNNYQCELPSTSLDSLENSIFGTKSA